MTTITICPTCSSALFVITESSAHVGRVNEQGILLYKNFPRYVSRNVITCQQCGRSCEEKEFADIDTV